MDADEGNGDGLWGDPDVPEMASPGIEADGEEEEATSHYDGTDKDLMTLQSTLKDAGLDESLRGGGYDGWEAGDDPFSFMSSDPPHEVLNQDMDSFDAEVSLADPEPRVIYGATGNTYIHHNRMGSRFSISSYEFSNASQGDEEKDTSPGSTYPGHGTDFAAETLSSRRSVGSFGILSTDSFRLDSSSSRRNSLRIANEDTLDEFLVTSRDMLAKHSCKCRPLTSRVNSPSLLDPLDRPSDMVEVCEKLKKMNSAFLDALSPAYGRLECGTILKVSYVLTLLHQIRSHVRNPM